MLRKFTNNLHHDKTLMFNISGFKLRAVSIGSVVMSENLEAVSKLAQPLFVSCCKT